MMEGPTLCDQKEKPGETAGNLTPETSWVFPKKVAWSYAKNWSIPIHLQVKGVYHWCKECFTPMFVEILMRWQGWWLGERLGHQTKSRNGVKQSLMAYTI